MEDCIFCRIIRGEIPSSKVYEDEQVFAFRDIQPQAPVHVLVIPKTPIPSMDRVDEAAYSELAACLRGIRKVAELEGLADGYRVVSNCGKDACQSVPHLHFHVMGGRQMMERMV